MNENEEMEVAAFAQAWHVDTVDITGRVSSRIESRSSTDRLLEQVLVELRSTRTEIALLREENNNMRHELARLRAELSARRATRISPFSPSENFARTSGN
jgi:hypothetical protein